MVRGKDPLNELGLFSHGIPLLGPGRKIESFLASAIELFQEPLDEPLEVIAEYKDATGRPFKERFEIDFRIFENLSWVGNPPMKDLAKSVDALRRDIQNLIRGGRKLPVVAYSVDDLEAEGALHRLFIKLRRASPDDRREIERMVDQEINRRTSSQSSDSPPSGEGR